MLATPLLQSAVSVLTYLCVSNSNVPAGHGSFGGFALAVPPILLVTLFYTHQICTLCAFQRHHLPTVWSDAEPPQSKEELDDPCFAYTAGGSNTRALASAAAAAAGLSELLPLLLLTSHAASTPTAVVC